MSRFISSQRWLLLNRIPWINLKYQKADLSSRRTYYDVLKVSPTCSSQEIKSAYVKLCMKCHPDKKPGDSAQHIKFIELSNAYTTLINANSRKTYDMNLAHHTSVTSGKNFRTHQAGFHHHESSHNERYYSWRDESKWYTRDRSNFKYNTSTSYYGIKGLKRVHNRWIVLLCFVLVLLGSMLHVAAYRYALYYKKVYVDQRSEEISKSYIDAKTKAQKFGNAEQKENLKRQWNLADNIKAIKE